MAEAVHEIRGWDDLRRRLEHDRRCYGFFHPSLPAEPLIFVEIGSSGLATHIEAVIDAPVPNEDLAIPKALTLQTQRSSTRSPTAKPACEASRSATSC